MTIPLIGATGVGFAFWKMLADMRVGTFNPHNINTPVLNRSVPDFTLPGFAPHKGFSADDLRQLNTPVLVTFFASWCIPCLEEMPLLMTLKKFLPLWGIAYKDKPYNIKEFLHSAGNPFARLAQDQQGRVGIDWGISGVPESFLIGAGGIIRWHEANPLTEDVITNTLLPLVQKISS
ncbi:MAG: redoxin domain-containing protein [Acetobacter sp.]|nr:redoxin domain-containing protein [Acetobacter sp.]